MNILFQKYDKEKNQFVVIKNLHREI
jgi:hypothetical protein